MPDLITVQYTFTPDGRQYTGTVVSSANEDGRLIYELSVIDTVTGEFLDMIGYADEDEYASIENKTRWAEQELSEIFHLRTCHKCNRPTDPTAGTFGEYIADWWEYEPAADPS